MGKVNRSLNSDKEAANAVNKDDLDNSFASTDSRVKFEVPKLTLKSCPTFERKFVVAPARLTSLEFYELPHPKENCPALYQIDTDSVSEVLQFGGDRSCFYGNTVVKSSEITMLSPIHPFFLVVPRILEQKSEFTIEDLTRDSEYPALAMLERIPSVLKALESACDQLNDNKFKQNSVKLSKWFEKRLDLLVGALKSYDGVSEAMKFSEPSLRHFAFTEIFVNYVPTSIFSALWIEWKIKDVSPVPPSITKNHTPVSKRKLQLNASAKKSEQMVAKKRKVLTEASKGTLKLTGFFQK